MSESKSHKRAKAKAPGKKEVKIKGGRKLDSASAKTVTEVERSGTKSGIKKAVKRLADSGRQRKVLQVPQKDMPLAEQVMKEEKVSGTLKNMGATKSKHIPKKKK